MTSVSMRLLHIGDTVPGIKIGDQEVFFPEAKDGDTIEARQEEEGIRRFLNGRDITFLYDDFHGEAGVKWIDT